MLKIEVPLCKKMQTPIFYPLFPQTLVLKPSKLLT